MSETTRQFGPYSVTVEMWHRDDYAREESEVEVCVSVYNDRDECVGQAGRSHSHVPFYTRVLPKDVVSAIDRFIDECSENYETDYPVA